MTPFRRFNVPQEVDSCPDVLTDAERTYLENRLSSGAAPTARLTRKLVRLCDERLARILELERIAFPLLEHPMRGVTSGRAAEEAAFDRAVVWDGGPVKR